MARWKTLKQTNEVLGRKVNLNRTQWAVLILALAVPVLAIVSSVFGLNYETQANQSAITSNDQLIDELNSQRQDMEQTISAQSAVIAKQKKTIASLQSNNEVLSSSLTATEAELAENEDKKKDDKKKDKCNYWNRWDCD